MARCRARAPRSFGDRDVAVDPAADRRVCSASMPESMMATFTLRPVLPPQAHSVEISSRGGTGVSVRSASGANWALHAGRSPVAAPHYPKSPSPGRRRSSGRDLRYSAKLSQNGPAGRCLLLARHARSPAPSAASSSARLVRGLSSDVGGEGPAPLLEALSSVIRHLADEPHHLAEQRRQVALGARLLDGHRRLLREQAERRHVRCRIRRRALPVE